jgi:hypothetical protein
MTFQFNITFTTIVIIRVIIEYNILSVAKAGFFCRESMLYLKHVCKLKELLSTYVLVNMGNAMQHANCPVVMCPSNCK